MRFTIAALALALPSAAMAQTWGEPMTTPVTPRDIPWYMAHPDVMEATLRVCHSNAAYGPTPDCQNAERASIGIMTQEQRQAAQVGAKSFYDPAFWDGNPILRATIMEQCRRRGPGDQIAYPYCRVAAASSLRMLQRH